MQPNTVQLADLYKQRDELRDWMTGFETMIEKTAKHGIPHSPTPSPPKTQNLLHCVDSINSIAVRIGELARDYPEVLKQFDQQVAA